MSLDQQITEYDNAINALQAEIDQKRETVRGYVRAREVLIAKREAEKKFAAMSPAEREAWQQVAGQAE